MHNFFVAMICAFVFTIYSAEQKIVFDTPTLFFVEKVENHAAARALYYDKGRLGILLKKESIDDELKMFFVQPETRDLHEMRVFAANVEALYLKVALRKKKLELTKF